MHATTAHAAHAGCVPTHLPVANVCQIINDLLWHEAILHAATALMHLRSQRPKRVHQAYTLRCDHDSGPWSLNEAHSSARVRKYRSGGAYRQRPPTCRAML